MNSESSAKVTTVTINSDFFVEPHMAHGGGVWSVLTIKLQVRYFFFVITKKWYKHSKQNLLFDYVYEEKRLAFKKSNK